MRKYVKFTGSFKDLIPNGWTFQKLFARNYRQYHKTCDGSEYGQGCRIWQHLGSYLEIEDFFSDSYILVEKIAKGEIREWITTQNQLFSKNLEEVCWMYMDREKKTFYPYHSEEYKAIRKERWDKLSELSNKNISEEDFKIWSKKHYDRYRECNFDIELFGMIKDLLDKGWIAVCEDKRK